MSNPMSSFDESAASFYERKRVERQDSFESKILGIMFGCYSVPKRMIAGAINKGTLSLTHVNNYSSVRFTARRFSAQHSLSDVLSPVFTKSWSKRVPEVDALEDLKDGWPDSTQWVLVTRYPDSALDFAWVESGDSFLPQDEGRNYASVTRIENGRKLTLLPFLVFMSCFIDLYPDLPGALDLGDHRGKDKCSYLEV